MICPRCSVAEISEETNQCVLCGFSPAATAVMVDEAAADQMQAIVQKPLAGRFEIEQLIGRGRVSFVYTAKEVGSGNTVALKIIPLGGPLDADVVRRFEREASRAASLRHSHIIPIHGSGASGSLLWYAMEQVKGQSLAELLRDRGALDQESCLRMLDQVASALDYAHRRGIVHGNLKPTNILVDDDGWVRVTDFAIMRAFGRSSVMGVSVPTVLTPEYMAPEQFFTRTASASADQYAMAVVAYECLSGSLPFVGDSFEEVARLHQEETPPRLTELREDIPILIADAVEQALRKRPTDRFANVLDLVTVLRGGPPQGAEPVAPVDEPRATPQILTIQAPRRQFRPVHFGLGGLAVILALAGFLLTRGGGQGETVIDQSQFTSSAPRESDPVTAETSPEVVTPPVVASPEPARPRAEPPATQAQPEPRTPDPAPTRTPDPAAAQTPATPEPEARNPAPRPPVRRATPSVDSARLFVNARPWGALYIDDELLGNTPKANLALAPGVHVIRVERDGYEPFELEIEVTAGEEVRVTDIVLKPRQP